MVTSVAYSTLERYARVWKDWTEWFASTTYERVSEETCLAFLFYLRDKKSLTVATIKSHCGGLQTVWTWLDIPGTFSGKKFQSILKSFDNEGDKKIDRGAIIPS